jgi:hypothetical protein
MKSYELHFTASAANDVNIHSIEISSSTHNSIRCDIGRGLIFFHLVDTATDYALKHQSDGIA